MEFSITIKITQRIFNKMERNIAVKLNYNMYSKNIFDF